MLNTSAVSTLWTGLQNNVHNKPKQNDPQRLGLPHTANWFLVPVCQHLLCLVFIICFISPPIVVSLAASVSSVLSLGQKLSFPLFALTGSRPIIENFCYVRFFLPVLIPYCLFPPYYSLAVQWNVAFLSNLQLSAVFPLLMSEGIYKNYFHQFEGRITCLDTHW